MEDAGKYRVTAKNELGESNATISLNFDSEYLLRSINIIVICKHYYPLDGFITFIKMRDGWPTQNHWTIKLSKEIELKLLFHSFLDFLSLFVGLRLTN